jgi:hypothetical protein
VAVSRHFEIEGLERQIYRIAEDGVAPAYLIQRLEAAHPGGVRRQEDVWAAVQRLVERKILVNLSGRLVGLAITAPVRPMAAEQIIASREALNPTYGKMNADRLLDQKRPSIALACIRLPQDEPLSRWLAGFRSSASAQPTRTQAEENNSLSPVPRSPVPYHVPDAKPRYIPLQPI